MEQDFYIIEEEDIQNIYIKPILDLPNNYDTPDTPLSPIKINTPNNINNINKLLIFVCTYKLSTINWAFLQLPDFVSKHI